MKARPRSPRFPQARCLWARILILATRRISWSKRLRNRAACACQAFLVLWRGRRALPARLCETPHFIVSHPMPVSLWIIVLAALALIALALFALFTRLERGLRDEIAEAGRAGRAESSANFAQFQQTVTAQLT